MTYTKSIACRTAALTAAAALVAALLTATALAAGSGGVGPGGTAPGGAEVGEGEFPVRAKHTYGDGLGAGRNHQGQDLMAKCGKPVVASYSGRIQFTDYQANGGGNYVVIDGAGKLEDTVYMHLLDRSKLRKGETVQAGDLIGRVGNTGRSSACHLHFEIWSTPGWYEGGKPLDPEPYLRTWDRG